MTQGDKLNEDEIRQQMADPSPMTIQMMGRQIYSLKELLISKIEAQQEAIKVAHEDLVRVPTDVQNQVGNLRELLYLKVGNLEKQFELIEKQRLEQKSDTRLAIDAALQAAKELVVQQNLANNNANAKTEASFSKQIEQQAERINDIKERQAKTEGHAGGVKDFAGWIVAAIAILFSLINYLK